MKTKPTLSPNCGALALLALLSLPCTASETAGTVKDQAGESPTHVLFTGSDIRILHRGKLHPVQDVDGTSLIIKFEDNTKGIDFPVAARGAKFVVARVQALTDRSATVTNFKHERAYTPERDPARKTAEAIATAHVLASQVDVIDARVRSEPEKVRLIVLGGLGPLIDNPDLPALKEHLRMTQSVTGSPLGDSGYLAGKGAEEQAREDFDALEVKFELSSEKPLRNAYVVVMANYHTKDSSKDTQTWLSAKELGAIDSTPRKVWLREGGFPPGFVLEKVNLHVYERGVEIATDLSENRAPLTRDEAHEYLVIDHLSTHKSDTLPARIALAKLPEDWTARTRDASIRQTCYVKVDEAGYVGGLFEDKDCKVKVDDPYLEAVFKDVRFLPALENGKAVDSVAQIKLADLRTESGLN